MPELECLLTSSKMSDDDLVLCFSDTSCARVTLLDELTMQPTEPISTTTKARHTHPAFHSVRNTRGFRGDFPTKRRAHDVSEEHENQIR